MFTSQTCKKLFLVFLLASLASCGGGGGGSNGASNGGSTGIVAAPALSMSISSVTPIEAQPGDTLEVHGNGLGQVREARIGGVEANFSLWTDTKITMVVPDGGETGIVQLKGAGVAAQSPQRVTILGLPSVTAFSSTVVKPGESVQLSGRNLDTVREVRLNNVPLQLSRHTALELSFVVPPEVRSGILALLFGLDRTLILPQTLTVQTPVTLTSFSPRAALAGDTVTIVGDGLDLVTQVMFGDHPASDLRPGLDGVYVTVPNGARSAPLTLIKRDGGQVQSRDSFTVIPRIIVTDMQPHSAVAGQVVVVVGANLTEVDGVTVGHIPVDLISRSDTEMRFAMPPLGGEVELRGTRQRAASVGMLSVPNSWLATGGFSPSSGVDGTAVTISGAALPGVFSANGFGGLTSVSMGGLHLPFARINGGAAIRIVSVRGGGAIVLEAGAQSLTLGNFVDLTPSLAISASICWPAYGDVGSHITIGGKNLNRVASATVGGASATIYSQSGDELVLLAPAGGNGSVVLQGDGSNVSVGKFGLSPVAISHVDVAQTYFQAPGDPMQRLVPGKEALLRVLVAGRDGLASPPVQVIASAGGSVLGTAHLVGPATLAAVPQASPLDQAFTASLPAAWVRADLSLRIDVDPLLNTSGGASTTVRPVVGRPTNLVLVLVPLSIGNGDLDAVMPNLAAVRTALGKVLPIAESAITVKQRASYRLTSVSQVKSSDEWSKALNELDDLREAEGQQQHYYGLVPDASFSAGTSGLGYRPASDGSGGGRSSIGLDARRTSYMRTMTHELGHNFGRSHAPCGDVVGPDLNYPYSGGTLGVTPIFDSVARTIVWPESGFDVMGYCGGDWFSDYNYQHVQMRLESWLYPSGASQLQAASPLVELLEISGMIDVDGVHFRPVTGSVGRASVTQGDHVLDMALNDGNRIVASFTPMPVADGPSGQMHFKLRMVKPSAELAGLEVLSAGKPLAQNARKARVAAQRAGDSGPQLAWKEAGGQLQLSWDDSRYRYLRVSQRGRELTTLARELEGGKAMLPLADVPKGGEWHFVLSDGLNTRLIRVVR